jgi:hypothetical protein
MCYFLNFTSCIFCTHVILLVRVEITEQRSVILSEKSHQYGSPCLCLETFVSILNSRLVFWDMTLYLLVICYPPFGKVSNLKTLNFAFICITQLLSLFVIIFLITFFLTGRTIYAGFLL